MVLIMNIKATKIHILADLHGEVALLNRYINKHRPEVLVILGDCAFYWNDACIGAYGMSEPVLSTDGLDRFKSQGTKVFWIRGNHDVVPHLDKAFGRYGKEPIEIKENLWYCPIGSSLQINELNCLFVGGANSYDKQYRTKGVDWFPDEILTESDLNWIRHNVKDKVDVVFSHTCPVEFDIKTEPYKTSY